MSIGKIVIFLENICPVCTLLLSSPTALRNHMKTQHDIEMPPREAGRNRPFHPAYLYAKHREDAQFEHSACPSCWKHFPIDNIDELVDHYNRKHLDAIEDQYNEEHEEHDELYEKGDELYNEDDESYDEDDTLYGGDDQEIDASDATDATVATGATGATGASKKTVAKRKKYVATQDNSASVVNPAGELFAALDEILANFQKMLTFRQPVGK